MSALRRLSPLLRPHARVLALVAGLLLAGAVLPALSVLALERLMGAALSGEVRVAAGAGGLLLALQLGDVASRLLRTHLSKSVAWTMARQLRMARLARLLGSHGEDWGAPGAELAALLEATDDVQYGLSGLIGLVRDPLALISLVAVGLLISPRLCLLALVISLPMVLLMPLAGRRVRARVADVHARREALSAGVAAGLRRREVLQAYGVTNLALARLDGLAGHDATARARLDTERGLPSHVAQLAVVVVVVALVLGGTAEVAAGRMAGEGLVAFGAALGLARRPLQSLAEAPVLLGRAEAAISALEALGPAVAPTPVEAGPDLATDGLWVVRSRGVVLQDITAAAPAGSWVAVVGPTGAGKSTLLRALAGLVVRQGVVTLPITDDHPVSWVPQADAPAAASVRAELALGRPGVSESAMWHALEVALLADVVRALPAGLDSPLAALGRDLSGGELQRLWLARALITEPGVLLLDEPSAPLDEPTSRRLIASLQALSWAPTVVCATHDPVWMAACDLRWTLDGGRLINADADADREAS